MKSVATLQVILVVVIESVLVLQSAEAASVNFDELELNGRAEVVEGVLRLVPAEEQQHGSAFIKDRFPIGSGSSFKFNTFFQFRMAGGGASGADGLVFVVQNERVNALGGVGGDLGYDDSDSPLGGIKPSIGVEFDTFDNGDIYECSPPNCPDGQHIGIDVNGSKISDVLTNVADLRGASRFAWIEYDGGREVLEVFLSDTNTKPTTPLLTKEELNLAGIVGSEAFFGFTAATGFDNHDIEEWRLTVVPIPAAVWLFGSALAGLGLIGWRRSTVA
jgi:hypothetical protein